ncbi:MAG: cobyrinate a,c-diamide synthase [Magnetococcus sp. YQC-5]
MNQTPGFIIAATHSHAGKTTVALAVMSALQAAGWNVAPFKVGPDFIDPLWHAAFCGVPSYNLDTFMIGAEACRTLLATRRQPGAVAVVEGVMGLYDGKIGIGGAGSTADLAKALGMPVVLVVDAKGMAGSIAPLVAGFAGFAQGFEVAGVLANRVGSATHARILAQALEEAHLPPLLGWLQATPAIGLGERHLGLVLPDEQKAPAADALRAALTLDLETILDISRRTSPIHATESTGTDAPGLTGKRIAVAQDQAFCFIYPANLEWLQNMGAEIQCFSPLAGEPLPSGCDALWLPGGYPELHAERLSVSNSWHHIRKAVSSGMPVLAECGGMMALGEELILLDGVTWPMAKVLPIRTRMTSRLAGLGYRQERSGARGHEFHHSTRDLSDLATAFQLERGDAGVRWNNLRASYVHWYFPSCSEVCCHWFLPD